MGASLKEALRAVVRGPALVALLWAWSALLSAMAAVPALVWWTGALATRPRGDVLVERFDLEVLKELSHRDVSPAWGMLWAVALVIGLVALLSNALIAAGLFEAIWTTRAGRDPRSPVQRFWAGAGRRFWVNLRVLVLAIVVGVALASGLLAIADLVDAGAQETQREWLAWVAWVVPAGALAFAWVVSGTVLDFARARLAADDTRSAVRAWLAALGHVVRHAPSALVLWTGFALLGAALVITGLTLGSVIGTTSWVGLAALVLAQQAVVAARAAVRVAWVGAVVAHAGSRGLVAPRVLPPAPAPVAQAMVPVTTDGTALPAPTGAAAAPDEPAPEGIDERRGTAGTD